MNRLVIRALFLLIATSGFCQSTETSSGIAVPTLPVKYLIGSAAADFHAHGASKSIRFRNVRIGHVISPDGKEQYMLCGEFTPTRKTGKTEWAHFVTIKTSGYEQYSGDQAASLCQRPSIKWDIQKDLSSSLQSRFDSLGPTNQ